MKYSPDFEKWWAVYGLTIPCTGRDLAVFKEIAWKAYFEGTKHDYLVQDEEGNWMTEAEHHSLHA